MTFFLITPPYLRKAESLPARERGLKPIAKVIVKPCQSRSPRGSVD